MGVCSHHHDLKTIDDWALVGSANWSKMGLYSNGPTDPDDHSQSKLQRGNHEAGLLITSAKLCKAFVTQFNYDWLKRGLPVEGAGKIFKKRAQAFEQLGQEAPPLWPKKEEKQPQGDVFEKRRAVA